MKAERKGERKPGVKKEGRKVKRQEKSDILVVSWWLEVWVEFQGLLNELVTILL